MMMMMTMTMTMTMTMMMMMEFPLGFCNNTLLELQRSL
jgi:hypothetical protein